jgi:hypothetical protein
MERKIGECYVHTCGEGDVRTYVREREDTKALNSSINLI